MVSEPRQIACPKCRAEMGRIKCGPIVVDRCGDCGGLWFDRQEYQQLVVHLEGRLDVGDPAVGASMDGIRDCPCPVCAIPMIGLPDCNSARVRP